MNNGNIIEPISNLDNQGKVKTVESYPIIDEKVYAGIDQNGSLRVVVYLENSSLGEFGDYERVKQEILLNLTPEEFNLKVNINGTDWLAGIVTKKGLDKLSNSNLVHEIVPDAVAVAQVSGPIIDSGVYNILSKNSSILVIIYLDNSSLQEFGSYEEVKREILSNLTAEEFVLTGSIEGRNWFGGTITKEGLDKIANNDLIGYVVPDLGASSAGSIN